MIKKNNSCLENQLAQFNRVFAIHANKIKDQKRCGKRQRPLQFLRIQHMKDERKPENTAKKKNAKL